MKKFIAILCVLILLPTLAFSAASPTPKKMIRCVPEVPFEMAENTENWAEIYEWLYSIRAITKGYTVLDAVYVTLDKEYSDVKWYLTIPVTEEHEPFVLIMDEDDLVKQDLIVMTDNTVLMNFENFELKSYYLCFFIKDAE